MDKEMVLEMHPSVKKVAEFMQRELPADELRGVAEAIAVVSPAIWSHCQNEKIQPMQMGELEIISSGAHNVDLMIANYGLPEVTRQVKELVESAAAKMKSDRDKLNVHS